MSPQPAWRKTCVHFRKVCHETARKAGEGIDEEINEKADEKADDKHGDEEAWEYEHCAEAKESRHGEREIAEVVEEEDEENEGSDDCSESWRLRGSSRRSGR
ncbi:hypothetical protein MTO96_049391 [Rhipicephalus appendiculatus]